MPGPARLAVVGGGWAGLAAAVRATQAGQSVTLFEMAGQFGGRARGVAVDALALDNGQHILIGAYGRTLDLMRSVGADPPRLLSRQPLSLVYPDGQGLRVPPGPAWLGFARAVGACRAWSPPERIALLGTCLRWAMAGFRCAPGLTVADLCAGLPESVRRGLIDPLCVAALNTPAADASAAVWLRVLKDALFSGQGSADLLLPRRPLSELLPLPAARWLGQAGAQLRLSHQVREVEPNGAAWRVNGEAFDSVVLACTAIQSARLVGDIAPAWAARAQALRYEPIVTVYLRCPGARLPSAMTALHEGPEAPAQFAFDHGQMGGAAGLFAFVISGAAPWVQRGLPAIGQAVLHQAQWAFPSGTWPTAPELLRVLAEKRATFRCTPGLDRPPALIAPGLVAAGDYVEGPYPATLEGAVRAGEDAARLCVA